ncbi:hypothetical protein ACQP2F_43035 [Actinoplanes sp. CA-030573]|uniref:hypothetical protein n=1 Tax=Actinoplanes sp. CA-030573 TaxID=3239898 RepID=UPI003D8FA45C
MSYANPPQDYEPPSDRWPPAGEPGPRHSRPQQQQQQQPPAPPWRAEPGYGTGSLPGRAGYEPVPQQRAGAGWDSDTGWSRALPQTDRTGWQPAVPLPTGGGLEPAGRDQLPVRHLPGGGEAPPPPPVPQRSGGAGKWVLLAAVVLLVGGLGYYFFMPSSGSGFDVQVTKCAAAGSMATVGLEVHNRGSSTQTATVNVEYRDAAGKRLDVGTVTVRDIGGGDTTRTEESTILDVDDGTKLTCLVTAVG